MQIVLHKIVRQKEKENVLEYGILDETGISQLQNEVAIAIRNCVGSYSNIFNGRIYSYNRKNGTAQIENDEAYQERLSKHGLIR